MTVYQMQFPIKRTSFGFDGGLTTLCWQASPAPNDLDANALYLRARDFFTLICQDVHTSYSWTMPTEYKVLDQGGAVFPFSNANMAPIVGADTGALLPHQTQGVITWRTALRKRSGIGRTFIPGVCVPHVDTSGQITAGYRANVEARIAAYIQPVAGGDTTGPVVWSRTLQAANRITSGRLSPQWSVLRSRRV
jgi:hypothetical protein